VSIYVCCLQYFCALFVLVWAMSYTLLYTAIIDHSKVKANLIHDLGKYWVCPFLLTTARQLADFLSLKDILCINVLGFIQDPFISVLCAKSIIKSVFKNGKKLSSLYIVITWVCRKSIGKTDQTLYCFCISMSECIIF